VQVISHDITERKKAEQELVQAKQIAEQSAKAIERFLAYISHEIRTPLNTVVGMAHLLRKTITTLQQHQYLQSLQAASNHLLGIIKNVLDFSKIEAGAIEFEQIEFKLANILESVKQTLWPRAQEKNLALTISYNHRIPQVLIGDPIRLDQILLNLVGNAIKFTEKGAVAVTVELLEEDAQFANLVFSVADSGIGIPADKLSVIFDNFAQATQEIGRKYGGSGLGLAIAKQLVEMQGGTIAVVSQIDKGSTFRFTLKFKKVATGSVQPGQAPAVNGQTTRLDGLKVLLVEDDKLSQRVAGGILGKWGASVEVADNGRIAIQKLAANSYDLVLIDVLMPEMDGYETAYHIRNEMNGTSSGIPIIAMTASTSAKVHEKILASGINDYITKPFAPESLYTKIMKLIDKSAVSITAS
jgi:CheY-like chemotaxis protein/nitrogen-specific signal transduction histidine kinase